MRSCGRLLRLLLVAGIVWSATVRADPITDADACVCTCCVENRGERDCIRKEATTFLSQTCTECNVTSCAIKYPKSCGIEGASIQADCTERTAWYLRLIPVLFVVATVALLFYGFFIKTFDGYHPEHIPGDESPTASLSQTFSAAPYMSISQTPFEPRSAFAVKRPSPLSQAVPLTSPLAQSSPLEIRNPTTTIKVTEPSTPPSSHSTNDNAAVDSLLRKSSKALSGK